MKYFLEILVERYALKGTTLPEKNIAVEKLIAQKIYNVYKEMSKALRVKVHYEEVRLV